MKFKKRIGVDDNYPTNSDDNENICDKETKAFISVSYSNQRINKSKEK